MAILLIAEHDGKQLSAATTRGVTAALQLGEEVHVLVAGHNVTAITQTAAQIEGVQKVLHADAPHYAEMLAEQVALLIIPLVVQYTHVVMVGSTTGRDLMPRIAGALGVPMATDVVQITAPDMFVRPIYAGNALERVKLSAKPCLLTIRATTFTAAGGQAAAAVETIAPAVPSGLSSFVGRQVAESGTRPELGNARVVVSGGRGFGSAENFKKLESLADKLGAAIGASRAAVDAGYAPNAWQVGQTGKVVAPELYIALGISGAIQHLAGMKDSRVIVAINKDENAPIFEIADYGLVADLSEALPALEKALS